MNTKYSFFFYPKVHHLTAVIDKIKCLLICQSWIKIN